MGNLIEFSTPGSAHISHLQYDPDKLYLSVRFQNDSSYTFAGVPPQVFASMTRAPSSGKFFHNVIKRHYKLINSSKI